MNLSEIMARQAEERPDAPAILSETWLGGSRILTFGALADSVARASSLLVEAGLRPGDAVLVFHPMAAELYVALLAIFRLRLVAMFLDPSAGVQHMERCCGLVAPKALLASTKAHLLRLRSPALRRIPVQFAVGWCPVPGARRWDAYRKLPPHPGVSCEPDTPALLTFTSGSTGQPKAAVRTHGFLLAQHRSLEHSLQLQPGEIDLTTLPIFLLANLGSGVTSVVPNADLRYPGAIDAPRVVAQIRLRSPVSSTASPAFFECLTRYCLPRKITLPSFRKLFTGGAPVFPRLLEQMQVLAPNADVVSVYGSTEAEPMSHSSRTSASPEDRQAMLSGAGLLAGPPVPGLALRIVLDRWGTPRGPYTAEQFTAECLPAGTPGEIVVSGGHVLGGYLHGRGDEETKFKVDGVTWHRTGDAGYLDDRGRVWLLGRCVARIQDAHGTAYPFAVEAAAYTDPRVRRAALVAREGRRLLAIELSQRSDAAGLEALREKLAWAHVAEVRALDRIPVDGRHNAKIDYPALNELLGKGGG